MYRDFFLEVTNRISPQESCKQKIKDPDMAVIVIDGLMEELKKNDATIQLMPRHLYRLTGFGENCQADRWDMEGFLANVSAKMGVDHYTAYYWRFERQLLKELDKRII